MTRFRVLRIVSLVLGTATATAFPMIVGFLHWLDKTYTVDRCFVRVPSSCRAIVPGEPAISTRLYQLGPYMRFLLVLTSKSPDRLNVYYIDGSSQKIGVPDFGNYRPFRKSALVSWLTCEGYPDDGAVVADWHWINDDHDLRIRVRGLRDNSAPSPLSDMLRPDLAERRVRESVPEMIQLAYGREIILHYEGSESEMSPEGFGVSAGGSEIAAIRS
jgi:hypothetical protein